METCPQCGMSNVHENTIANKDGDVVRVETKCYNCGYVLRATNKG